LSDIAHSRNNKIRYTKKLLRNKKFDGSLLRDPSKFHIYVQVLTPKMSLKIESALSSVVTKLTSATVVSWLGG